MRIYQCPCGSQSIFGVQYQQPPPDFVCEEHLRSLGWTEKGNYWVCQFCSIKLKEPAGETQEADVSR